MTPESLEQIRNQLLEASESEFVGAVNDALTAFYGPIAFASKTIEDSAGATVSLESVAYPAETEPLASGAIPADAVAIANIVCDSLDLPSLRLAFGKLRQVKRLAKTPSSNTAKTVETLTAVIAKSSAVTLDAVAQEIRALNRTAPDSERLDMVVVLSQGVVDYKMRFFGDDQVNMMLPPSRVREDVVPVLVYLAVDGNPSNSVKSLAFVSAAQCRCFYPEIAFPDVRGIVPSGHVALIATYQYDLSNVLREVDAIAPPLSPFSVVANDGTQLLELWLQPWQQGSVIVAKGQMPLLGLLVPSGLNISKRVFQTSNGFQLSSATPLDAAGFSQAMVRVAKRSRGISIRKSQQSFTLAKLLDEGTTTPFVARISMTPLTIRDIVLNDKGLVKKFDDRFQPILNGLIRARSNAKEIEALWNEHEAAVASGRIAHVDNAIHVDVAFDGNFNDKVDGLIAELARTLKKFQKVAKIFGIDIGFFFQNEPQFQKGLAALRSVDPELADYLQAARPWAQDLRLFRDDLEHGTYVHPMIQYSRTASNGVEAHEPLILGVPVRQYFATTVSRVNRFIEEILMWCYQRSMPTPMMLTEIPRASRDPNKLERFKIGVEGQGETRWIITYSEAPFDEV